MVKKNTKVVALIVLFILSISLLAACAGQATPTPTQAPKATPVPTKAEQPVLTPSPTKGITPLSPPVTVKVGHLGSIAAGGPVYIALEKGYFKELGLNVELVPFTTVALMIAPLGTGQLDLGADGGISVGIFNAVIREVPIRFIAAGGINSDAFQADRWLVRKDLIDSGAIKTPADLKGKTVGVVAPGVGMEVVLSAMLAQAGLTMKDIIVKQVSYGDQATAFANKSIDLAFTFEPSRTIIMETGQVVFWKSTHSIVPGYTSTYVMYSPLFMQNNAEAAKRFMLARMKAVREYNNAIKNKKLDEVINILIKYTALKDKAIYAKMNWSLIDEGRIDRNNLQIFIDYFEKGGLLQGKLEMNKLVDDTYVDYALQVLGK